MKAKIAVVYIFMPHTIVKLPLLRNSRLIHAFLHTATPWNYLAPIHGTSGKTQTIIRKQRKRSNWKQKSLSYTYSRLTRSSNNIFRKDHNADTRIFAGHGLYFNFVFLYFVLSYCQYGLETFFWVSINITDKKAVEIEKSNTLTEL